MSDRDDRPTPTPRVTLKQIAESAGVHPATVSIEVRASTAPPP